MKTFKSRKVERKFTDILEVFPTKYGRNAFVNAVKDLRDKKITSQEGEYTEFLVTEKDLLNIAKTLTHVAV